MTRFGWKLQIHEECSSIVFAGVRRKPNARNALVTDNKLMEEKWRQEKK